jgi:hypothetical protein
MSPTEVEDWRRRIMGWARFHELEAEAAPSGPGNPPLRTAPNNPTASLCVYGSPQVTQFEK